MQAVTKTMEPNTKLNPVPIAHGIVCGPGSPLLDVIRACTRIAASDATVLLTGETGTGKEVFARMVHANSARNKKPFVPVNCAAIPESLMESELFGYVRGAFTGAVGARRGRVSMAESGTLFLDEVGDLPVALQVKLLRLLQNRTYEPVGSSESITGDFRLVAATNRDLAEDVRSGRFRRDLYYRLHVCPLMLPPLRERTPDISALFFHFWHKHGETRMIAPAVLRALEGYSWPGNVRELENLVERVSVCAEGQVISLNDLPAPFRGGVDPVSGNTFTLATVPDVAGAGALFDIADSMPQMDTSEIPLGPITTVDEETVIIPTGDPPTAIVEDRHSTSVLDLPIARSFPASSTTAQPVIATLSQFRLPVDLPRLLRETEETYIRLALEESGGNKKEAAKLLGMGRTTLVEKLRRKAASDEAQDSH